MEACGQKIGRRKNEKVFVQDAQQKTRRRESELQAGKRAIASPVGK